MALKNVRFPVLPKAPCLSVSTHATNRNARGMYNISFRQGIRGADTECHTRSALPTTKLLQTMYDQNLISETEASDRSAMLSWMPAFARHRSTKTSRRAQRIERKKNQTDNHLYVALYKTRHTVSPPQIYMLVRASVCTPSSLRNPRVVRLFHLPACGAPPPVQRSTLT